VQKNHLLIFSSFLDIWENVEWSRFFWTTLYIVPSSRELMQLGISQSQHSLVAVLHQNNQSNGPIAPKWPDKFLRILFSFVTKFANFNEFLNRKSRILELCLLLLTSDVNLYQTWETQSVWTLERALAASTADYGVWGAS